MADKGFSERSAADEAGRCEKYAASERHFKVDRLPATTYRAWFKPLWPAQASQGQSEGAHIKRGRCPVKTINNKVNLGR